MKITNAEINVIRFSSEDVIATSGPGPLSGTTISGGFYLPVGDVFHGASGTFGNYSTSLGAYQLLDYSETGEILNQADIDRLILASQNPTGMIDSGMGYPIPASVYANIAKNTYPIYSYNNGYYTIGKTYYETYSQ